MKMNSIITVRFIFVLYSIVFISCNRKNLTVKPKLITVKDTLLIAKKITDSTLVNPYLYTKSEITNFKDDTFIILKKLDTTFLYDMKYATYDNFLKEKVYDCADCLVRYKTAKQLIKANTEFKKQGYRIQFFDCYRPLDIQKKMWKIFPDKRYVANPAKGSNHNRGTAVDITLVNNLGKKLPMGTKFDFFGRKAHHAYLNFSEEIITNRKLLKQTMIHNGFWAITSEWWHYNLNQSNVYNVSNKKTKCE